MAGIGGAQEDLADNTVNLISKVQGLTETEQAATQAYIDAKDAVAAANEAQTDSTNLLVDEMTAAYAIQEDLARKKIQNEQQVTDEMTKAASAQGLTLDEYKAKLKETEAALGNYTSAATEMYKKISDKSTVSVKEMQANLEHNQAVVDTWSKNIESLAKRGIDDGLLKTLKDAGPESAGTVAALVKASDAELSKLSDTFKNGSTVAIDAMKREMGLPDTVNAGSKMVDDVAKGAGNNKALQTASETMVRDAKSAADKQVSISDFQSVGRNIINGMVTGIRGGQSSLVSAMVTAVNAAASAAKSKLGINSPSTLFRDLIGKNMILGIGAGIEEETESLRRKLSRSLDSMVSGLQAAVPTSIDLSVSNSHNSGGTLDALMNHTINMQILET